MHPALKQKQIVLRFFCRHIFDNLASFWVFRCLVIGFRSGWDTLLNYWVSTFKFIGDY